MTKKAEEKLVAIRKFAEAMEYEVREEEFISQEGTKNIFIELLDTWDSEGNPYGWVVDLETGKVSM